MVCDVARCRRPSVVGILPDGCSNARFICADHWAALAGRPGSVCALVRPLVGLAALGDDKND